MANHYVFEAKYTKKIFFTCGYTVDTTLGEMDMKKRFILLALLALALFLWGCETKGENQNQSDLPASAQPSTVTMEATVIEVGERLLVEVTRSEYTSGPHIVLINDGTVMEDANGNAIFSDSLRVGDELTILYSGQVMLSYPPQIVALSIILR